MYGPVGVVLGVSLTEAARNGLYFVPYLLVVFCVYLWWVGGLGGVGLEGAACRRSEDVLPPCLYWNFLWVGGVGLYSAPSARVRVFCHFTFTGIFVFFSGWRLCVLRVYGVGMLYWRVVVNGVVFIVFLGDNGSTDDVYSKFCGKFSNKEEAQCVSLDLLFCSCLLLVWW